MMKTAIALGVLVALAGCSRPATTTYYAATSDATKPVKWQPRIVYPVLTAGQATARCPQGWTQRSGKWVCRDPRVQEIYYDRLPAEFLKDVSYPSPRS